jgi:chromosome segregation ATPase
VQLPLSSVLGATGPAERPLRAERPAPPPELLKKVEQQEAWIRELEGRAATADERADLAEEELEALREQSASDEGEASKHATEAARQAEIAALGRHAELSEELERARAETETARRERDAFATRIRDLEAELEEKSSELTALGSEGAGDHAQELAALEEKLGDRGHEIRRLERELAEAERIGKDLVAELRQKAPAELSDGVPGPELDALAMRLATAEADREALSWVVSIGGGKG